MTAAHDLAGAVFGPENIDDLTVPCFARIHGLGHLFAQPFLFGSWLRVAMSVVFIDRNGISLAQLRLNYLLLTP